REIAARLQGTLRQRVAEGAPARAVQGASDELTVRDLFRLMGSGRKSGRLTLRSEAGEGVLHLENGRGTWAAAAAGRGRAGVGRAGGSSASGPRSPSTIPMPC